MTKNADSSPGDTSISSAQPSKADSRSGNVVFKSGHLLLSSKGIGWTSWKKRWFILTRTSLVFFRSDPNAVPQKGNEVNLILGGIDLNNSGSVIVKEDKKLITVLFPDGRDGRTFTLKAETAEDLHEWKVSLENALGQAPSAALMVGQNGIFRNGQADAVDCSFEHVKDKQSSKSLVLGRPILLALEDIDGTPSFLEKALRFIEEHGVRVEGILRQSASVDDVEHRIQEYEQGKMDFSAEEDSHVVADCIKYVLRELPSSPVPASCCNALLEAFRVDHGIRVASLRDAICETFPEPNRHLLQRVLMMMQTVASHKAENRMSSSAVSACMAPLLLRPLLAGDCELENDFDVGGDGSVQLLQAAAAANHAQAIVVTLLEEYDSIFGECSVSPILYSDSEDSGTSTSEDRSDDGDESFEDENDEDDDDDDDDGSDELDEDIDDDLEHASSGSFSDGDDSVHSGFSNDKVQLESAGSSPEGSKLDGTVEASREFVLASSHSLSNDGENEVPLGPAKLMVQGHDVDSVELSNEVSAESSSENRLCDSDLSSLIQKSAIADASLLRIPHTSLLADRPCEPKNIPLVSTERSLGNDCGLKWLQNTKADFQSRLEEEAQRRNNLSDGLQRRKKELHERRVSLEQDVEGLQEKLHREVDLRVTLETGLKISEGPFLNTTPIDEKIMADLEAVNQAEADICNLTQKFGDLELRLRLQREQNNNYVRDLCMRAQSHHVKVEDNPKEVGHVCVPQSLERSSKNKVSAGMGSSSSSESVSTKHHPPSSTSKKTLPKNEVINSTTSALSKLTTRLNFLKERRTQITTELQNLDKGRGLGQSNQSSVKGAKGLRESWWSSSQPMEGLSCPFGPQPSDKHRPSEPDHDKEVHEQQQQDRSKKSERNYDKARKSDSSNPQHDKARSDGHQSKDAERSRGSDGPFSSLWMNPR